MRRILLAFLVLLIAAPAAQAGKCHCHHRRAQAVAQTVLLDAQHVDSDATSAAADTSALVADASGSGSASAALTGELVAVNTEADQITAAAKQAATDTNNVEQALHANDLSLARAQDAALRAQQDLMNKLINELVPALTAAQNDPSASTQLQAQINDAFRGIDVLNQVIEREQRAVEQLNRFIPAQ